MSIKTEITHFFKYAQEEGIELYNEFSLQHELGVFLREKMPKHKIQFERNVDTIFTAKEIEKIEEGMVKSEIDITILNPDGTTYATIELKYPRKKQYPVQMYAFIEDIKFAEQLQRLGFHHTYCVVLVDDDVFYQPTGRVGTKYEELYKCFREKFNVPSRFSFPIPKKVFPIELNKAYKIDWQGCEWQDVGGKPNKGKFYCIEI